MLARLLALLREEEGAWRSRRALGAVLVASAVGLGAAIIVRPPIGGGGGTPMNCFASPGSCGYPDPAYNNVGVPSGTSLTSSGPITVTVAGTTVDALDVTGSGTNKLIAVKANNVTIQNSRLTVTSGGCGSTNPCGNGAIDICNGCTGTVISHVEMTTSAGVTVERAIDAVNTHSISVDHTYTHGEIDSLCNCANGNDTFTDNYSYVSQLWMSADHVENIYGDGSTLTATHNVFLNAVPQTATIFVNTNNGGGGACTNHLTINNNFLVGGGFTLYPCGNASSAGSSVISITNNRMARCGTTEFDSGGGLWECTGGPDTHGYYPRGGSFGVAAHYFSGSQTWTGNYWDDNLATFCPDRSAGCA